MLGQDRETAHSSSPHLRTNKEEESLKKNYWKQRWPSFCYLAVIIKAAWKMPFHVFSLSTLNTHFLYETSLVNHLGREPGDMFSILYFRHFKCMFLGWSTVFTPHLNNTRFYCEEEEVLSKRERRYINSDSFQMPVPCLILLDEMCKVKNTTTGHRGREYL